MLLRVLFMGCLAATPAFGQSNIAPANSASAQMVDPTKNVLDLVTAAVKRLDDLREQDLVQQKELRISESARLDSIRQVDRDDVAKATSAANQAIATLAKQTTDLSTTLAKQVTDTATANEARQSAFAADIVKRLSALELSASERTGKQQVSDPQMERLNTLVEKLASSQSNTIGQSQGLSSMWGYVVGGLGLVGVLVMYLRNGNGGVKRTR